MLVAFVAAVVPVVELAVEKEKRLQVERRACLGNAAAGKTEQARACAWNAQRARGETLRLEASREARVASADGCLLLSFLVLLPAR